MKQYKELKKQYGDFLSLDELSRACRIAKRSARYLVQNGMLVADCVERDGLSVDMKKADLLRQFSEKGKLNAANVNRILAGEAKAKPNRTPMVKIEKTVYAKYFKPNQPAKEVWVRIIRHRLKQTDY